MAYPCKYKYCGKTYVQKAALLRHYINVHYDKILFKTIEKYKAELLEIEDKNKAKTPKSAKKSKKKFKKPFARFVTVNIRN